MNNLCYHILLYVPFYNDVNEFHIHKERSFLETTNNKVKIVFAEIMYIHETSSINVNHRVLRKILHNKIFYVFASNYEIFEFEPCFFE